jgi:polyhydroxyalkanoate synthesis regulator phasin
MADTLERLIAASLGAMSMTRQKAENLFEDLVKRGHAEKGRRTGFVREVMDSADKTRKEMEDLVTKQVKQVVEKLDLISRSDLALMEKKIDQLLKARSKQAR